MLSEKLKQILKRKKEFLKNKFNAPEGSPEVAEQFELLLKLATANIPPKYWDYELNDLDEANSHVKTKLREYCDKFQKVIDHGQGLFLAGSNGTGKTLAACIVLKEALRAGYSAYFTSLSDALAMMSDGLYNKEARTTFQEDVLEVDFLVIDDITKIYKNTEKQQSTYIDVQFDRIFRSRANYNLPIIITSNHNRRDVLKSADEVLTNSLLSLFSEHLKDIVFLGKDRRVKSV